MVYYKKAVHLYQDIENTEAKTLLDFGGKTQRIMGQPRSQGFSLLNCQLIQKGKTLGTRLIMGGFGGVEYTTVFLHSDWMHFLWHGIKSHMCV